MKIKEFSYAVVIPTRNRQHTAIQAIESAIRTGYKKLQIVVSDNSDTDQLFRVLSTRGWLRHVTYKKTNDVLSIRDNWEHGVELADADYVSVIGDDDAILEDALYFANAVLSKHTHDVFRASHIIYKWPDYQYVGHQNLIEIPLGSGIFVVNDPKRLLRSALKQEIPIGTGPGIYHGLVSSSFLQKIKSIRGRFFIDQEVDFDSGYCTLLYSTSYVFSERPLFISGNSRDSNSGAQVSSAYMYLSTERFRSEAKLDIDSIFEGPLQNLVTSDSGIISAQFRMLPEIRNVLNDENLTVDKLGAFRYLTKRVSDGQDGIDFFDQCDALLEIAQAWGISDTTIIPKAKNLGWGLLYEQGLKRESSLVEDSKINSKSKQSSPRLIVNGNKLNVNGIGDVSKIVSAFLPQLFRTDDGDILAYAAETQRETHQAKLDQVKAFASSGQIIEAQQILVEVVRENPRDPTALSMLGQIYLHQEKYLDACSLFARSLSFATNLVVLEYFIDCLVITDQLERAKKVISRLINQNPSSTVEITATINKIEKKFNLVLLRKTNNREVDI